MTKYRYRIVSGASLFGYEAGYAMPTAKAKAAEVAAAHRLLLSEPLELERVLTHWPGASRTYWRMRGKRWEFFSSADANERQPALCWPETRKP